MKFFGKFEKKHDRIYRTKAYICLDSSSLIQEPESSSILGTIFMLNPGESRPLCSKKDKPFLNYIFNQYVDLETDKTMNIFKEIFKKLQDEDKYLNGIVEIKNLFNYRETNLDTDDTMFFTNDIENKDNILNVNDSPTFNGDFVFFAWGTSKLTNSIIKKYAKKILYTSIKNNKQLLYVSPRKTIDSTKYLSFYHPLGGQWSSEKQKIFKNSIYKVFSTMQPVNDFK